MGLNKFVALFTTADCHNTSTAKNHLNSPIIIHKNSLDRPNGISSTMYNSELDIYGTTQRFRKSLLWSSLRKPKKLKDHNRLATIIPLTNSLKTLSANSPSPRLATNNKSTSVSNPPPIDASSPKPTGLPASATNTLSLPPHHAAHNHPHRSPSSIPAQTIGRNNGADVDSTKIRQASTKTTSSKIDSARTIANGVKLPSGNGPSSAIRDKDAVISIGSNVSAASSVVSKGIGVNLGCGGDGSGCNGKSTEALGVLLQYLVFNLNAFGNAHWQQTYEKTSHALMQTTVQLENSRAMCSSLEDQLQQKDTYYAEREKELCALQRSELQLAKDEIAQLITRNNELCSTENELREKVHASETEFGDRLRIGGQRERELSDKVNALTRQLALLTKEAETKECQWQEKLILAQDELAVMRQRPSSSKLDSSTSGPHQRLQDDVESLRCVLDLKQQEISELRKQNVQLVREAEALPAATLRVHTLESRLEDLQLQLKQKTEDDKELRSKLKHVEQLYLHETNNRKNVTLRNEQLQWKLMQNSEKFSATLNELSKRYHDHSEYLNAAKDSLYGQENSSQSDISATDFSCRSNILNSTGDLNNVDDVSPPTTPVVKGVVKKNESVSWVLEMNDEETAEALTSRIVRRAGSFRSSLCDRQSQQQPNKKRQYSNGTHPLSQSASATAVLRQFSEGSTTFQPKKTNSPNGRMRSKSVSHSNNAMLSDFKKLTSNPSTLDTLMGYPLHCSSPRPVKDRSSMSNDKELQLPEVVPQAVRNRSHSFAGGPAEKTSNITSPYSSLRRSNSYRPSHQRRGANGPNSSVCSSANGRVDLLHAVSASMQDSPKFQQIKESAGEAMVSSTNSEDEEVSSSGSSDESMSISNDELALQRIDSPQSDPAPSDAQLPQRRMSLEDVMMHDEIESVLSRSLDEGF